MSKDKNTQSAKKDENKKALNNSNNSSNSNNYPIKTNAKALSKVSDMLNNLDIQDIPVLSFDDETEEFSEKYVSLLLLQLAKDGKEFNSFFQTITGTSDDFYAMDSEIYWNVAVDFFMKLPNPLKNIIVTSMQGLKKQRDTAIAKNEKMMEKTMKEMMKEKLEDIEIPIEKQ